MNLRTIILCIFLFITFSLFATGAPEIFVKPDPAPNGNVEFIEYFYNPHDEFLLDFPEKSIIYPDNYTNRILYYLSYPELGSLSNIEDSKVDYLFDNGLLDEILISQKDNEMIQEAQKELINFNYYDDRIEAWYKKDNFEMLEYLFIFDDQFSIQDFIELQNVELTRAVFIIDLNMKLERLFEFYDFHTVLYIEHQFDEDGLQKKEIISDENEILKKYNFDYLEFDDQKNWIDMVIYRNENSELLFYRSVKRSIYYTG